jgi:acyl dehydratase
MSTDHPPTIHTYDTLHVGDAYATTRFISEDDVRAFAEITGDDNPIHLDETHARNSRFGHRIVHGVLLLGLISKVLGRDYPGHGSIAVSISCRFLRPVRVGSEVRIEFKVVEKIEKYRHVRGKTYVYTEDNKIALAGEATLIPPTGEEGG